MRKLTVLVLALLVGAAITVPLAAWAVRQDEGQEFAGLDRQDFVWTTQSRTTSSEEFKTIPELRLTPCTGSGVTVDFSGTFSGAPVELRAVLSPVGPDPKVLIPGVAEFTPSEAGGSFSFVFARDHGRRDHRTYDIQWRSPTGGEVTLDHALARVLYKRPNQLCR